MRGTIGSAMLILIVTYLSLGLNIPVLRQLVGFVFLTFVPGYALLSGLKLKENSAVHTLLFSVGLSVAFLMAVGLSINALLPLFGIPNPLSLLPIAAAIVSGTTIVFLIGFLRDHSKISVKTVDANSVTELRTSEKSCYVLLGVIIIVILPLLSAIGAIYKNTFILILAIIGIAALYATSIFLRKFIPSSLYPLIIFAISISLILQTVSISTHIIGYDIFTEYSVFNQTVNLGYWNAPGITSSTSDIGMYNSVLSITILPTIYSIFLNLDGELVFKLVYPFIFSLLPLALYMTFRLHSEKSISLLATFFFMSNSISFYGLEPLSVTRQIVAELFLVLAIFSLTNENMDSSKRRIFFMIFSTALVISHYSLSFIFLFFVLLTYILSRIRRKGRTLSLGREGPLSLGLILFLIATTFAWYMYVSTPPLNRLTIALQRMLERFFVDLFQPEARFQPALMPLSPIAQSSLVGSIHKILIYISMFFVGIGLIVLLAKPKKTKLDSEFRLLAILSGFLLVLCLVVPDFAPMLNFTRFYQIALLFLALLFPLGGLYFLELIGDFSSPFLRGFNFSHRDLGLRAVSLVLIIFFLFQSGFVNHVANSYTYSFSLDFNRIETSTDPNTRAKILRIFVAEQDIFSAQWLGANIDNESLVYADYSMYGQVLPDYALLENERIRYLSNTTELESRSYVYLRSLNVREGMIDTFTYTFNLSDISTLLARSDTIYSNGESEIHSVRY